MDWLLDLGNTRLKATVHDGGRIGEVLALAHGEPGFEQRLAAALDGWPLPRRALMASVASPDLAARVQAIAARAGVVVEPVRTRAEAAGVRIAYADPSRLGVDRFLTLLAARRRADRAWLVVGVGTALTLDLMAPGGLHVGGLIAPSPDLMRAALAGRSARLPADGGETLDFATDTLDALASGCQAAALGLVDVGLARATRRLGEAPALLLAGGGAPALLPALVHRHDHAPHLVLEGLAAFAAG